MGEIHTFPARKQPVRQPFDAATTRARIEEAAQHAIDTAEQLIAILNRMDGNSDDEDGRDAEPSLSALEGRESRVVWLRGTDKDLELDHTPEMDQ